jgi:hypothetical protein
MRVVGVRTQRLWVSGALLLVAARIAVPALDIDLPGPSWAILQRGLEVWIAAGLLAWAVRDLPWRRAARAVGPVRSLVLIGLAAAIGIGQFAHLTGDPYPVTRWAMYSVPVSQFTYLESTRWVGDSDAGPLLLRRLAPTIEPLAIQSRLGGLLRASEGGDAGAEATLVEAVRVLAARTGEPRPDRVVLSWCVVREPTRDRPETCEVALAIDLDEDVER